MVPHKKYPVPDFGKFRSVCLEQWLLYGVLGPAALGSWLEMQNFSSFPRPAESGTLGWGLLLSQARQVVPMHQV